MANSRFPPSQSNQRPRILIIEDEHLIALMIGEMVRDIGYVVSGVAHTFAEARREITKHNFDAALLDISLDGLPYPQLADVLLRKGVPFAFLTGYDYVVEPRHEKMPVLQKPFSLAQFRSLLMFLVRPKTSNGELAERLNALRAAGPVSRPRRQETWAFAKQSGVH